MEQATSRAAAGREADWTKEVVLRLEDLSHAITEHIEVTERDGGLYDEICGLAPHLSGKIDRLREEHPGDAAGDGRSHLEVPRERARRGLVARGRARRPPTTARRLVRHRQLGSDLVWEAYNLDIGGIE